MESKRRVALLLGTFTNPKEPIKNYFALTENSKVFDLNVKGALTAHLIGDGPFETEDRIKLIRFSDPTVQHYVRKYDLVALVDFGPLRNPTGLENADIKFENIAEGVLFSIKCLKAKHFDQIDMDLCEHPRLVGTAVALTLSALKTAKYCSDLVISVKPFNEYGLGGELEYEKGVCLGKGQTLAQNLMKSASVADFVSSTKSCLGQFGVDIFERNDLWMDEKRMHCLLGVAKNSEDRPVVLEIVYNNSQDQSKPLVLVGKANPYENSLFPLSVKPELRQFHYRSGMGGASTIVGVMYILCKLKVPVRVHCIVAVVWNQLHDKPNKKGDVLDAMNGTSIQIDSLEAEGRLIMADVLCYADTLDSSAMMDVTTLSSNVNSLIGNNYIAYFTSNDRLKRLLDKASERCGEKVWQLPLYRCFRALLKTSPIADISNVGVDEKSATAVKSAVFLQEFVSRKTHWIHLDTSAVTECRGKRGYLPDWATGRSTRLVAEFCLEFFGEC